MSIFDVLDKIGLFLRAVFYVFCIGALFTYVPKDIVGIFLAGVLSIFF